jgi:predicted porin
VSYQKDITAATTNPVYAGSTSTAPTTAVLGAGVAKGFAVTDANFKLAAVEDLGGGLKATFDTTFETGAQRGALLTRADSGLGLTGGFGAVAVRNTRTSDLIATIGSSAISLPDGLYDNLGIVSRGAIDAFVYTAPTMNGFTASLAAVEGVDGNVDPALWASADTTRNKSATVAAVNYAAGPLSATVQLKSHSVGSTSTTKKNQTEFAVSYDLGVAKVAYAYDDKETTAATAKTANGFSVTVPMGAVTAGANMFKRGDLKQTEVGVSYAFSKRTSLNVASGKMSGHATATKNGTQNRIQLKHTF